MTYTDYYILWNDFAISKFFSLEELSIDIIEAFRSGFGGSSHGCKEFDTNYIEFDAKKCECTYQGRKMNVSVTVSGKNRCIYLFSNAGTPWKTLSRGAFEDYYSAIAIRVARDTFALLPVEKAIVHVNQGSKEILLATFERDKFHESNLIGKDASDVIKNMALKTK